MGTTDGLAKHPYVREARRIRALRTVVEQDVSAQFQPGPRAATSPTRSGIGWYPIDIHRSGPEDVGVSTRTRPFQIPLGALIPGGLDNLLAAAKNIGTTHITNGCYRLHPVEWNIGEAAGALADWSLARGQSPERIWRDGADDPALSAAPAGGRRPARLGHRRPDSATLHSLPSRRSPPAACRSRRTLSSSSPAPRSRRRSGTPGWARRGAGDAGSGAQQLALRTRDQDGR